MRVAEKKLKLVFCWHFHQPDYRHYETGEFMLPWTYLHALKDYTDMAAYLERQPKARAVVNFVPVLLDQIEDYTEQFRTGNFRDPLLRLLIAEPASYTAADRALILDRCFRGNHATMIAPFPAYERLHHAYELLTNDGSDHSEYLSDRYMSDLVTWYHLAWTGETVRRSEEWVARLMSQGTDFSHADRLGLCEVFGRLISGLIPRYKKLADAGQIELSCTPHSHPIAPLLIDLKSARESAPEMPLPLASIYPGGLDRARFHVRSALESHEARFGVRPVGMWPAEGALSQRTLQLFASEGVRWAASGEQVLVHSLEKAFGSDAMPPRDHYLYRPYRLNDAAAPQCFFRDDRLSDLIGFEYSKWHGRDAVAHFMRELEDIQVRTAADENPIVTIILDGENAWEYYPYNGYYFLTQLYDEVATHADIEMSTFGDCLGDDDKAPAIDRLPDARPHGLPHLVAGSWVYGSFSTWIGSPEKNRAWDLLCAAKQTFDLTIGSGRLDEREKEAAYRQLTGCESSDWFWWFGDYNPSQSVASFDTLFRENLASLYRMLKLPVPHALDQPLSHGGGHPEAGGAMRRAT